MNSNKSIQVFEHEYLPIDGHLFKRPHWESLGWYNKEHGGGFFSLTPAGVKFGQYVGVIQVGDLTIEILPKIGRTAQEGNKDKWQQVLLDMLKVCRWMQLFSNQKAQLRHRHNSILETYLELFLNECETLVHKSLLKKYSTSDSNRTTLKGKLLFSEQVRHNSIHQERFYTRCQVYDRNNPYNQILYKALRLLPLLTSSPMLKDRIHVLLLSFPEMKDIKVNEGLFLRLNFGRKEAHYKPAIEIAAMLLMNFRPDIRAGRNHILALLFDMNELWEEYLFHKLLLGKPSNWEIKAQSRRIFWKHENLSIKKQIRPDLVITDTETNKTMVLDTKWKIPDGSTPSDADLKQIFVYNEYWNGLTGILIYPSDIYRKKPDYSKGSYQIRPGQKASSDCGMLKISVLNKEGTGLDREIGERIRNFLIGENVL